MIKHARSCRIRRRRPDGVTVVEVSITAPLAFLMIIGLIVGGLGTFRYQQVANLAREGANYASIHGPYYANRTGQPIATANSVMQNAVLPLAAGLDSSALQCTLNMDVVNNTVTVTLQYNWLPEGLLPATTLSSTSTMLIEQ
jgi:Flp pilus assembly protein TadG